MIYISRALHKCSPLVFKDWLDSVLLKLTGVLILLTFKYDKIKLKKMELEEVVCLFKKSLLQTENFQKIHMKI